MSNAPTKRSLRWLEVRVQADGEAAEAVSELFSRLGNGGAVLEQLVADGATDDTLRQYWVKMYMAVHTPAEDDAQRRRAQEGLWHLRMLHPIGEPEFRLLADEDWAETWKANYHPLQIGRRIVIKPSWCEYTPAQDQLIVELDPGQAFGTGLHPSTQFCLLGLEDWAQPGQTALDLGSGSGILAIAAVRLGVERVLALDVDALAVEVARENAGLNGASDKIEALVGSLPPRDESDRPAAERAAQMAPAGFDLMLVNILAEVIADLLGRGLAAWLAPGGVMITAGIIREREALVATALEAAALHVVGRRQEGDWVSLIARR